jgi:hypothetical protein
MMGAVRKVGQGSALSKGGCINMEKHAEKMCCRSKNLDMFRMRRNTMRK